MNLQTIGNVMNPFMKRKALSISRQVVTSVTMNKQRPVSKGGTRLATLDDVKLAVIEMSQEVGKTQRALNRKAEVTWRAGEILD